MPANLKIFKDVNCTQELEINDIYYQLLLGPVTGLDGDFGDRSDVQLYIKNIGDKPAMYVRLFKENDPEDRIDFSSGGAYVKDDLQYPDILQNATASLLIRLIVQKNTPASLVTPTFYLKYKTLP
jgi:hypothetical protein